MFWHRFDNSYAKTMAGLSRNGTQPCTRTTESRWKRVKTLLLIVFLAKKKIVEKDFKTKESPMRHSTQRISTHFAASCEKRCTGARQNDKKCGDFAFCWFLVHSSPHGFIGHNSHRRHIFLWPLFCLFVRIFAYSVDHIGGLSRQNWLPAAYTYAFTFWIFRIFCGFSAEFHLNPWVFAGASSPYLHYG